ncbi:unnamed protein product [Rangifer tarandus platyrhynchus]|uniref:Uncharacterized protein n=2 Tax=Rangifer tarandus platyrhynchus TaxID=3082113 RepID=A0AC59Z6G6_RANTA|nr:unnamed protein product [Rangifer tarandus platyrhynchus]
MCEHSLTWKKHLVDIITDCEMRRSPWIIWVGTECRHKCLYREGRSGTQRGSSVKAEKVPPATSRGCWLPPGNGRPGGGTADTMISDFCLPVLERINFCCFQQVTKFMVVCYSIHRKLTESGHPVTPDGKTSHPRDQF